MTMNAPRDWDDHKALYEYGRSLYKTVTLDLSGVYSLHIVGGVSDTAVCTVEDDARVTVKKNGEKIRKVVYMRRFEYAPVYAGEQTGSVVFFKGDRVIYEAPLYADNKVEAKKDAAESLVTEAPFPLYLDGSHQTPSNEMEEIRALFLDGRAENGTVN